MTETVTRVPAHLRLLLVGALVTLVAVATFATEAEAKKRGKNVTVMSRNIYLGADLGPALRADSIPEAIDGAGQIYNEIERTNFPERAVPLAREIDRANPDLIGLQEVALWREQIPSDGGNEATTGLGQSATVVKYDFLKTLRSELRKRGARYKLVAKQKEFEGELPADVDNNNATGTGPLAAFGADLDARLTMRDVVLAKRKVKTKRIRMEQYENRFEANVGGVIVPADRGWISLNARVGKAKFRFINTHLEAFGDPRIKRDQARELFAKGGPLRTRKQVILVGDLNSGNLRRHNIGDAGDGSDADQLAFEALKRFGLEDRGAVQSCCDSVVNNPNYSFDHTVDHVLVRPKLKRLRSYVTGDDPSQVTPSGLRPSDHGGVVSKLRVSNIRFR